MSSFQTELEHARNQGKVSGPLYFELLEQGKFNLNDLAYSANQPQFVALLRGLMPQMPVQKAYEIAKAITTWLTNNSEDAYYLTLHPPYRAPQDKMADISELQLVAGVTPEIYLALAPYVTALPIQTAAQAAPSPRAGRRRRRGPGPAGKLNALYGTWEGLLSAAYRAEAPLR